ncbi:hypothetical protein BTVI_26876 [Pitangus sulphuratus]|nr:hypothetical protein BTVI_26876 [Pitangus sulphuratus]
MKELEGAANTPQHWAALQKDLERLERWPEQKLVKFNKGKGSHLGHNNPKPQDRPGAHLLENSSVEKDLGVLVDHKLSMTQQCPCCQEGQWDPGVD